VPTIRRRVMNPVAIGVYTLIARLFLIYKDRA